MAVLGLLPWPSNQVKVLALLIFCAGSCTTTAAAMVKAFDQEESSKNKHDQRIAAAIHNPYTSSLSTSETPQNNPDDYWYTAVDTAAVTPPAPKCWRNAMYVLLWQDHNDSLPSNHRKHGPKDAATLCQSLPDSHQKLLALEIARCHMADLGRDLFLTPPAERAKDQETVAGESTTTTKDVNGDGTAAGHDLEPSNCHEPLTNVDDMYFCLKYLTDPGANAYTQYVAYVQLLCTRLTQEVFLTHQQEVQQEMARRYQDVASQSVSHMETIHSMAKLQTDQFHALATELPEQMRVKLTFEIQEQLSASVNEHLDEHLGTRLKVQLSNLTYVMQEQATNQALALQRAWEQVAVRERQEQTAWWKNSSRQLQEEQRDAMKRAWERLDALLLSQTSTSVGGLMSDGRMQSIMAGLEFLLTTVTRGYSWLAFLLYFVTTLNMIWLFTRPRICHGFRAHLFAMVLLEAAAELVLLFLVEKNLGVLTERQRVGLVQEIRRWTIFLECTIFAMGLFVSMFSGSFTKKPRLQPPPPPTLTEPTMLVDTTGTVFESFRPVRGPRCGSTSNGNMKRMNHHQHQQQQQQQQQRLLHFNTNGVTHQQPFSPMPQVTPQQQQPQHQQQPVFEQPLYYSPIAGSSRGRAVFGRGGGHAGTAPMASDSHHYYQQLQEQQQHHQQFQSPSPFVPLHASQHQQQQQHQQMLPPPPPPPPPVMYPHFYSSPLPSRALHGDTSMWTSSNVPAITANNTNNCAHDGTSFPNSALDPATSSRFSLHPRREYPVVVHEQQYQQHQYQQSPSVVSLVRDNSNNSITNNNPYCRRRVSGVSTTNVAAIAAAASAHGSWRGTMRGYDEDEEDVFMDALCEIPNEEYPAVQNLAANVAVAATTRPIPTTAAASIMPTQDYLTHENAMVRTMLSSPTSLVRKKRRRAHNNDNQESADSEEEEDDDEDEEEKRPPPRKKKQAKNMGTTSSHRPPVVGKQRIILNEP